MAELTSCASMTAEGTAMSQAESMDIGNRFMVGCQGNSLVILNPPTRLTLLSPDEALLLAAWLVAMAKWKTETVFADVLERIENT